MKHNLEESPSGRKTSMCWFLVWFSLLFIFLVPGEEALLSLKPEWAPDLEHWVGNSPQLKVLILFLMSSREAHVATAAILTGILSFIIVLICLGFFFFPQARLPWSHISWEMWAYAGPVSTYWTSWYTDVPPQLADIYSFWVNEGKCWQFHTKKRAWYEIWIWIRLWVRKEQ